VTQKPVPNLLGDLNAARIVAGDTEAVFLPSYGMIGVEEDVLVTEEGAEYLHPPQMELVLI